MKKLLLVVTCATLLFSSVGKQLEAAEYSCAFPKGMEIVAYSSQEYSMAMYSYGVFIAYKRALGKMGKETAVDINIFHEKHNLSIIGEAWVEKREDGYYSCMDIIFCNLEGKITSKHRNCKKSR